MSNNNHKKRKVMLIAALAVAVIALAGAGYALTTYKATTINSGNTAESKYIVVEQDGDYTADFDTAVEFNTYTDSATAAASKVIYTLTDDETVIGSYKGVMIGDVEFTMTSAATMTNYNLKAVTYSGTLADGWTYILKVKDTTTVLYYDSTSGWTTSADGTGNATITISSGATLELYIASQTVFGSGLSPAPTIPDLDGYAGFPASVTEPAANILNNVTLLFEITGNEA